MPADQPEVKVPSGHIEEGAKRDSEFGTQGERMQLDVSCPTCGSTFKVDEQHLGKNGKCAKCGGRVKIERTSSAPHLSPPPRPVAPPPVPPPSDDWQSPVPVAVKTSSSSTTSPSTSARSFKQFFTTDHRLPRFVLLGGVLGSLVVGYFAGREHLKYELRSLAESGGEEVAKGFAKGWQDGLKKAFPALGDADDKPNAAEPVKMTEFGQFVAAPNFQMSISDARVDHAELKNIFNDKTTRGKDLELLVSIRVKNTDERKILRYSPRANLFRGGIYQLRDDVENAIRGVDYSSSSTLVGALTETDDILPGQDATHLEVFSIPPPKTKHVVLTVALASFGGEGKAAFKIPVERIKNFPR